MSNQPWVPVNSDWDVAKGKRFFTNKKVPNLNMLETNILSLTLRGVVKNNLENPEGLVPQDYSTYQIVEKDDLIFKLIDLENIRTSRVGLVPERGIMSSAYIRLIPSPLIFPKYAYWWFYNLWNQNIFNSLGGGVRANLSADDLLELEFPLPNLDEQIKLSEILDQEVASINDRIERQKNILELMNDLRRATITDKFRTKLGSGNHD